MCTKGHSEFDVGAILDERNKEKKKEKERKKVMKETENVVKVSIGLTSA